MARSNRDHAAMTPDHHQRHQHRSTFMRAALRIIESWREASGHNHEAASAALLPTLPAPPTLASCGCS